jgi:hypothetical protein
MQNPQLNLRIDIIHLVKTGIIELHYPASTAHFWHVVAMLAQHFLEFETVKVTLREHHKTAAEWSNAQKVLVHLAYSLRQARITVEETHHVADLVCVLCIQMRQPGEPWKWSRTLLKVWAQIARYQLSPLFAVYARNKRKSFDLDPTIHCYEKIRKKVGDHPAWLSLQEVHDFWLEMRSYRGENECVLELERRLNALSRMYHLALETTVVE